MHKRLIFCIVLLLFISCFAGTGHSEQRQTWALCFDANPLGYALGDEMERALMDGGWRDSHVHVVTSNSTHAFLNGLQWLTDVARQGDTVIFYFSGHGYNGGMGIGSDAFAYTSLDDELDEVACRGMCIILDSCHSGSAIPVLEQPGRVILTSCRSRETSGYFSEAVISALSAAADCNGNNDGSVSAEEVYGYVMGDWTIAQYTPQIHDGYRGNMSLLSTLWGARTPEVFQVHGQRTMDIFSGERWLRQSFIPTSTSIEGVALKIARWKNATTLQVAIYNQTGGLLQQVSIPVGSLPDVNDLSTWTPVDMHVNVTPGETHYLVCSGVNSTGWWWGSTDHYPDGAASVSPDQGASWHPSGDTDLSFIVYGEADTTPPQVTLIQPHGDGPISGLTTISWSATDTDDDNLNGSIALYASRDGGHSWTLIAEGIHNSGRFAWDTRLNRDGTAYRLKVTAVDSSGNIGADTSPGVFTVDNSPPQSGYMLQPSPATGHNGWYTGPVAMSITATDTASGVNRSIYRVNGGAWSEYREPFTLEEDGEHTVHYYAVDNAGHTEEHNTATVKIDATRPVSTHEPEPSTPDGDNGWYRGTVDVSLAAHDDTSTVESIRYAVDGTSMTAYTGAVTITGDGAHTLSYRSVDRAGNEEAARSATFRIDGTAPSVHFAQPSDGYLYFMGREILPLQRTVVLGRATLEVDAFDAAAGVDRVEFYVDGELHETVTEHPFAAVWNEPAFFEHTIRAVAHDRAGNEAIVERDIWIFNL